ncbi:glycosyltransferase family 2 protein [Corallincola spongiicola]|uniref:glycosyltransferase family 2 protein n=1 Tax=Corallincola spongiicola TaxID=2520508 RepID=UPI0013EE8F8E|nr:glycosyltransferase [Corallincola spongiicola]
MSVLVSVIIPAYNRDAYIAHTVESVLNQSLTDLELIVVDDGSTDRTREVLDSYTDSRLTILEHPGGINKGQAAAINVGLKQASGEYLAILDSDDYWAPEKLETLVTYLQDNPEYGLVYSNGFAVDPDGKPLYPIYSDGHEEQNDPSRVVIDCYFLLPNNAVLRREIMTKVGEFDESLRAAQDHDMAIRVAEVTKMAYLDLPLFFYRRHPDSISSQRKHIRWQNGFYILDKAVKRYGYSNAVIRQRKAVLHFRLYQCRKQNHQWISALSHLLMAGLLNPARASRILRGLEAVH